MSDRDKPPVEPKEVKKEQVKSTSVEVKSTESKPSTKPLVRSTETKTTSVMATSDPQPVGLDFKKSVILLKLKLNDTAQKIKMVTDQGRLAITDESNLSSFKGMFKRLETHYSIFQSVWYELFELFLLHDKESEFPSKNDSVLRQNTERYYNESCTMHEDFEAAATKAREPSTLNQTVFSESRISNTRSKLPRINVPTFDGANLDEWPFYRDTFKSIVHDDTSIGNIEKFHHLITSLSGAALSTVKSIALLAENYEQAWEALKNTYDDPRWLATSYLQQIIDYKPLQGKPTASSLRAYTSGIIETVKSLRKLKIPDLDEFILFTLAVRGLDSCTRELFEAEIAKIKYPKFSDLSDFVQMRCRVLGISRTGKDQHTDKITKSVELQLSHKKSFPKPSSSKTFVTTRSGLRTSSEDLTSTKESNQLVPYKPKPKSSFPRNNNTRGSKTVKTSPLSCCICDGKHTLNICPVFICASAWDKIKLIEGRNVCRNCLYVGHKLNECRSVKTCRICEKRHHTLLHLDRSKQTDSTSNKSSPIESATSSDTSICASTISAEPEVLLGTALALIRDSKGGYQSVRLLVDSASQHSFITSKCVLKLGLKPSKTSNIISGLNCTSIEGVSGKVMCALRSPNSTNNQNKDLFTEALVVTNIASNLPSAPLHSNLRSKYSQYKVADPTYWKPGPIDLLLGADLYCEIVTGSPILLEKNEPNLLPTIFGYILIGRYHSNNKSIKQSFINSKQSSPNSDSISTELRKFWELEEPVVTQTHLSKEEQYCEDHFLSTYTRTESGRFMVTLPLKKDDLDFGNSKQLSLSRFLSLESKLNKDAEVRMAYMDFMHEYFELGHMIKSHSQGSYYIPHHAVVKRLNSEMKLRVVFDASAKASYVSLNDMLLPGPKLQQDICDIVTNFRIYKIVFSADIKKMFRQILINPSCHKFLHIVWRSNPSLEIEDFTLVTLIYGLNCAPYLAIRCLLQLVSEEGQPYPLASKALKEETYVDDIVTGADTIEEALKLKKELIDILALGGFELSKWSSNSADLLSSEDSNQLVSLSPDETIKILGFHWDPRSDSFSYTPQPIPVTVTKRTILSTVARIYDPLGYLAPIIFFAKQLLQSLWILGCNWDDPVPKDIHQQWIEFANQLCSLKNIQIPRYISSTEPHQFQLIGFSDASSKGYCGVLYVRLVTEQSIRTFLIKAKTRLAPIKTISVPRLELCGALLLSRLVQSVNSFLTRLAITDIKLYTDSSIVLHWLQIPPIRLNVFVANRVTEIIALTAAASWKHVSTDDNPADLGSRGLLPSAIINNKLWWNGPSWLSLQEDDWPISNVSLTLPDVPELREKNQSNTVLISILSESGSQHSEEKPTSWIIKWMEGISSYTRLVRSIAHAIRFIRRSHAGSILASEFSKANIKCIKLLQSHYFSDCAKSNPKLQNRLSCLSPFYDEQGILRVGGRLKNANISDFAKHPILLPRDAHFTSLLIDYFHLVHLHLGPSALQAVIQTRYWIPSARSLIRKRTRACLRCFKFAGAPQPPIMADLPKERFKEGGAFYYTGVDFFGPINCRETLRRKSSTLKAYVSLFICLATKAVHLEVVPSLSTRDFLDAFDRFIARRGKPYNVISDCGTNFMGAASYLKEVAEWIKCNETRSCIIDHACCQGIEWKFNPPRAPHFGGLWEAGVKQAKVLFKKVIGTRSFTKDELVTLFTKIEAIMNSRPISPCSADPNDPNPLSPGHFLIGRPLTALPEPDLDNVNENRLVRWQAVQQRTQEFWRRWKNEYLQTLQSRSKWRKETVNLAVGDLVFLINENTPPLHWPTGIITETFPGSDGVVRVVSIRTTRGTYKRPTIKLISINHITKNTSHHQHLNTPVTSSQVTPPK